MTTEKQFTEFKKEMHSDFDYFKSEIIENISNTFTKLEERFDKKLDKLKEQVISVEDDQKLSKHRLDYVEKDTRFLKKKLHKMS